MSNYVAGFKKAKVKKQGVRGEIFTKTVYKPTVNGRVVGQWAAQSEAAAIVLAEKWIARFGG
jgi:hypothetical protein